MDFPSDFIGESRVVVLGLNARDFERYILAEGLVTQFELAAHPEKVSELMSDDKLWSDYEAMAEERYQADLEDHRNQIS